jgi:hypothetical protein
MALIKGMGTCLIMGGDGLPCGKQIQEGEAIGTVTGGFNDKMPLTGHKKCADAYHYRVQQSERAKREAQVKLMNQSGPGGPVDPTTATDALVGGSIPLEKPEPELHIQTITAGLPPGSNYLGDLPEDATPDEAVAYAEQPYSPAFDREAEAEKNRERMSSFPRQVATAKTGYLAGLVADSIPTVDAKDGRVVLTSGSQVLRLDPDDSDDLRELIAINANRARRQLR